MLKNCKEGVQGSVRELVEALGPENASLNLNDLLGTLNKIFRLKSEKMTFPKLIQV